MMLSPISPGTLVHQRYAVLQVLNPGQAGWVYLAEDHKRNRDRCVLEEWLLPEECCSLDWQDHILEEFQPLMQLRAPHLPRYLVAFFTEQRLYFVRNWIDGEPYHTLLDQKLAQGLAFSEMEVLAFLQQVLPVLNELHRRSVIHQNLTLDTLYHTPDGWVVPVEFGLKTLQPFRLQNHYFMPPEQQSKYRVACDTDLYAVAAIAVVLLTGQSPDLLFDEQTHRWTWIPYVSVSPQLVHVLDRMLSPNPPRRYASAAKVMQALVEDGETGRRGDGEKELGAIAFFAVLIGLAAIGAWQIFFHLEKRYASPEQPAALLTSQKPTEAAPPKPQKKVDLNIDNELLNQLVNDVPPEEVSEKLALLSPEAQSGMGRYKRATYNTALAIAKQQNVSPRSVEALTDGQFIAWFPQMQGKKVETKTWGQVWYAIAQDQATAIQTKSILKPLQSKTQLKDTLTLGQGKVYLLETKQGQTIRLDADASKPIRLSVFPPPDNAFPALNNSTETEWSGKVQKSGTYEIVVTTTTSEPVNYSLKIEINKGAED